MGQGFHLFRKEAPVGGGDGPALLREGHGVPLRPDGDPVLSLQFCVMTLLGKGDILWHPEHVHGVWDS